jgi:hypothetical protein
MSYSTVSGRCWCGEGYTFLSERQRDDWMAMHGASSWRHQDAAAQRRAAKKQEEAK